MRLRLGLVILLCAFIAAPAAADSLLLYEVGFNIDGTTYSTVDGSPIANVANPLPTPPINAAAFDYATGLGVITLELTGAGAHVVNGYFDIEYLGDNNSQFNELGEVVDLASKPASLSWEMGDPFCCVDADPYPAGVYYNSFKYGQLADVNNATLDNDVAVALGWGFMLGADEIATLSFVVSQTNPGGFALRHFEAVPGTAGQDVAYYRSTLTVRQKGGGEGPEPGSVLLIGTGLALVGLRRRR